MDTGLVGLHGSGPLNHDRPNPFHDKWASKTTSGFGSGSMNAGMHGLCAGIKGLFTPAQWIELEHQAMIYKYLTANVPVPSNLLIPIRKAIQSAAFPGFSIGSYPSHSYGWGSFHLGFSGNTDPELGRCRRTDGKKWRCSKEAVPDQKYCERHINRGRHRSRKPVEGHNGQAASGVATTTVVPAMSVSMSSLVTSGGGVPNGVFIAQHQVKGLQPTGATSTLTDPTAKRLTDQQSLSVMPPTNVLPVLEYKDSEYFVEKQHVSFEESSVSDFGIVSDESLLNPSQKSSYLDSRSYDCLCEFEPSLQNQDQCSSQHFPGRSKDQSHLSAIPWPKDPKSDWTECSMLVPMSSDLSPSPQTGLTAVAEVCTKQNEWKPIPRESPMHGGPLGEVLLDNASNAVGKNQRWDASPHLGSSPTGVLQKSTFVSLGSAAHVTSTSITSACI
ncbi:hypothetical protein vseg_019456 [Gypsophila vaccaria]